MLRHILLIAWYYLHWAEQRRGIFLHMLRRKMWVTAGMRLLCVCANRKMAVVLTTGSPSSKYVVYGTACAYKELYGEITDRKKIA